MRKEEWGVGGEMKGAEDGLTAPVEKKEYFFLSHAFSNQLLIYSYKHHAVTASSARKGTSGWNNRKSIFMRTIHSPLHTFFGMQN